MQPLFFGIVSTKESLSIFIDDLFFGSTRVDMMCNYMVSSLSLFAPCSIDYDFGIFCRR
jgi:hypothetical protein